MLPCKFTEWRKFSWIEFNIERISYDTVRALSKLDWRQFRKTAGGIVGLQAEVQEWLQQCTNSHIVTPDSLVFQDRSNIS